MAAYNYYGQNFGGQYGAGYFPQGFQGQPMMQQPVQPVQMPQMPQGQTMQGQPVQQIQNGGFITVRSEAEARNYPVAPGTSVTFKHETAPYCYTKTMGFSQFEAPRFEKFRLVKEEEAESQQSAEDARGQNGIAYAKEEDLGKLAGVVKAMNEIVTGMKNDVEGLKSDMYGVAGRKKTAKKAEVTEDDA